MSAFVRLPRLSLRILLVVLLAFVGTSVLEASAAHASSLKLTSAGKRPWGQSQTRCTSQTVAVTTPAGASTNKLIISGLDTTKCANLALSVVIYDPKLSATWATAQRITATSTVTAASLTLTGGSTFTPMLAQLAYVTIGGWQVPATFVPGAPTTLRTMTMTQAGKCLTVKNGTLVDGATVVLSTCVKNAAYQRWSQMSDGSLRAGGFCLTVPATAAGDVIYLQIKNCVGGASQQWTPDSTHADTGTFQWLSGMWWLPDPTTNGCLDTEGAGQADGTPEILYHCINNHANQEWVSA
jgi:hypothetical protein